MTMHYRSQFGWGLTVTLFACTVIMPGPSGMSATGQEGKAQGQPPVGARTSPSSSERATLNGQVVDHEGKPASGVEVLVVDGYLSLGYRGPSPPTAQNIASAIKRSVRAKGRTDGQGRFRLAIQGEPVAEGRRVILWAYKSGSLATTIELKRSALNTGEEVHVRLEPPATARYQVFEPAGQPIKGAKVVPTALLRDKLGVPDDLHDIVAATTDADGVATTTAFHSDEISAFRVPTHEFGAQQWNNRGIELADRVRTVQLHPVGSIKGRLVTPDDKILPGVKMLVATKSPTSPGGYVGSQHVTSDKDGRFEVANLPAGMLIIRTESSGPTGESKHVPVNHLRIEENRVLDLELKLGPDFLPAP